MSAKITISNVGFLKAVVGVQVATVKYRLAPTVDAPNPPYTTVSSNVNVGADGTLAVPVNITGLLEDTNYEVGMANNCNNVFKFQTVKTPKAICPSATDIEATAELM